MKSQLKLTLALLVLSQALCQAINEQDCSFPWQRVNDDICLFLTSVTKTRDHAKLLCNFYGGQLLFVDNEAEQLVIQNYLFKLIKYRFNKKPYIWLDATDRLKESEWLWSRNNESVKYGNWIPSHHNNGPSSISLNCACFKPNNGFWKDCDCSLTQHLTCRKTPQSNFMVIDETPQMGSFSQNQQKITERISSLIMPDDPERSETKIDKDTSMMNDELKNPTERENTPSNEILIDLEMKENQPIIVSTASSEILTNLDKKNSTASDKVVNLSNKLNARLSMLTTRPKIQLTNPVMRRQSSVSQAKNLMRIKVLKSDISFSTFHCPNGFGYYLIKGSGCGKYKKCENWNEEYASLSVNKCREGMAFNFEKKECVESAKLECNENMINLFVPEAEK